MKHNTHKERVEEATLIKSIDDGGRRRKEEKESRREKNEMRHA